MHSRIFSGWLLAALLAVPAIGMAEEPRGRARTWDIEANIGLSVIDTGFDRKSLGYGMSEFVEKNGTSKIPPTKADHVDTDIPTVGLRFGYSFTRYFALELGTVAGKTEVGDNTEITLRENFAQPPAQRRIVLRQQTATAPQILAAYETLEFDYANTDLNAVFKFNNAVKSKFVFYGTLGGGYLSLNPNSGFYNNCNDASNNMIFDASVSKYNGDPNAPAHQEPDLFEDNPEQLRIDTGCGRAFLTGTETGQDFVTKDPIISIGSHFRDAVPVTGDTTSWDACPDGEDETVDLDTGQISCGGVPLWVTPPGALLTSGFATTGKVNSFAEFFYTLGAGMRWHIKPRHVLRFDARRSFIENGNKNSNQFTVGYSFVLGRGKPDAPPSMAPPPGEMMDDDGAVPPPEDDGGVPPPEDDGGVPPPAEDDPNLGLS